MELNGDPSSSFDSYPQKWLNTSLDIDTTRSQLDASHIARETFVVNICAAAALTWVSYDLLLNLGKEISLVWDRWHERKGRHSRRIYVIIRYMSVLNLALYVCVNTNPNLTLSFCKAWYYVVIVNTAIITLLPDVLMIIRVNAVYGWNLRTSILTTCLFLIQMMSGLAIGIVYVSSATAIPSPGISIPGCSITTFNIHRYVTLVAWLPSIAIQFTYFMLMAVTLMHVMRGLDPNGKASLQSLVQVRKLVPTMVIYMRHGLCYYLLAITAKIMNAIIVVNTTGPLQSVGIPWLMALYPVLVSAIYLDMVKYLHAIPKRTHMVEASTEGEQNIRFSYASPDISSSSPPLEHGLGQITFAARASLSGASILALMKNLDNDDMV